MPKKNPEQEGLSSYKVHFVDGSSESFHLDDDLIGVLSKADKGGYHPIVFDKKKQFVLNIDNVLYIEDVTVDKPPKGK